ncbi:MAG: hypothetical protein ABSG86_30115 [Thermoguttaceae bacterium]|jgi:fermentation-respiration switch protein FrsA (DUF1100 family)
MATEIATIVATFLTAVIGYRYQAHANGRLTKAGASLIGFATLALALSVYKLLSDTSAKKVVAEERTKSEVVALWSLAFQVTLLHSAVDTLLSTPEERINGSQELGQLVEGLKWSTSAHSRYLSPEVMELANAAVLRTSLPLSDLKNHKGGSTRLPVYLERLQEALSALEAEIQKVGARVEGEYGIQLRKMLTLLFHDFGTKAGRSAVSSFQLR